MCVSPKTFTTQLVIETKLDDAAPSGEISSGLYQPDHQPWIGSNQIMIGLKPQTGEIEWGSGSSSYLSFSSKTLTDMDGDSTSGDANGKEVQDIIAKQIMQDVDAGTYTVIIKGLLDVAGNNGPGGESGEITDWKIRLK